MRKDTKFLHQLAEYAKIKSEQEEKKMQLNEQDFLSDLEDWDVVNIYHNCKVENDKLFDEKGNLLSSDGRCMNESIPYFVNQSTGYSEDDYYGTMYINVSDNTFIAVYYSC